MINRLSGSYYIFSKKEKEKNTPHFKTYIFRDHTNDSDLENELHSILNEIRQEAFSPKEITIIAPQTEGIKIEKLKDRFSSDVIIEINTVSYKNINMSILQEGIKCIIEKNHILQIAPPRSTFKKTSGNFSNKFIKASLALSDYPYISLIALCAYKKLKGMKVDIANLNTIYIDTSAIFSFVLAFIGMIKIFTRVDCLPPRIINFKSYDLENAIVQDDKYFVFISASSSGRLQKTRLLKKNSCLTLFYSGIEDFECICKLDEFENEVTLKKNNIEIPIISEDFSITYSKSKEFILRKPMVKKENEENEEYELIQKILNSQGDIVSNNKYSYGNFRFSGGALYEDQKEFLREKISIAITKKCSDYIICDEFTKQLVKNGKYSILKEKIINNEYGEKTWGNKNVIVLLVQTEKNELSRISEILRRYEVNNITYILGALLTHDFNELSTLRSNVVFNDSGGNYGFFCALEAPLLKLNCSEDLSIIEKYKLTNKFAFYEKGESKNLNPILVYAAFYLIFEVMRYKQELKDDIVYYDVISPENFYRFTDPLLQILLVMVSKGRELDFSANFELSEKMKEVIIKNFNLDKEGERFPLIGEFFVEKIKNNVISLNEDHIKELKTQCEKYKLDYFTEPHF